MKRFTNNMKHLKKYNEDLKPLEEDNWDEEETDTLNEQEEDIDYGYINRLSETRIDGLFFELVEDFELKNGDILPDDIVILEDIKKELGNLLVRYVKNNE